MKKAVSTRLAALWLCLAVISPAMAVQNSWTGAGGDMLWTNSANWSLGVLPGATQDISIDGTGTNVVVLNAPAEAANFSLGSNAVLNLAGDLTVQTNATIDGTLDWSSGVFGVINRTVVSSSGTWIIRSTAPGSLRGINLNNGTILCFAINLSGAGSVCQITNGHLFVINTNLSLALSHDDGFRNTGTLLVPAGNSNLTLTAACSFFSSGTIRVETNSSLTIRQGAPETLTIGHGTVFEGEGLIRLTDGSSPFALDALTCAGSITVNGTVELGGGRVWGSSGRIWDYGVPATVWSGSGLLRWKGGKLGPFTFDTNFHVEITGVGTHGYGGSCTNRGTIRWRSPGTLEANLAVSAPGEWVGIHNQGEFILETNCTLAGTFTNSGTISVPTVAGEGTLALGPDFSNGGRLVAETNAALNLVGDWGGAAFYAGTIFDGAGVVRFFPGAYPGCFGLGNMVVNGTVEMAGGFVNLIGTWTGPGLLRWTSGGLGYCTFDTNFNVEIGGAGTKGLTGPCTNLGTIRWLSSGPMTGGSLNNLGQFMLETNCTMACSFNNGGSLNVPADHGLITITNSTSAFVNRGAVLVETNSILQMYNEGGMSFLGGTIFDGAGLVRLSGGGNFGGDYLQNGNVIVNNTVELVSGDAYIPRLSGSGLFRWLGGRFGYVTIESNLTCEASGPGIKTLVDFCTNRGTIRLLGDTVIGGASIYNEGTFVAGPGAASIASGFVNAAGATFHQNGGQLSLGGFNNAGSMELNGELNNAGLCYNSGDIKLNGKLNSVDDGFWQYPSGSCTVLLHEDPNGTQINARNIVLGGSLIVLLADGFTPTNGSVFTVVTNHEHWYEFSDVTLPPLPGSLTWRVSYQPQTVALIVTSPTSMTNATLLPNGSFQFTLTGSAGGTYEIQASTNLVDWAMLTNAPFGGAATFTDTGATNFTRRFYRGVVAE